MAAVGVYANKDGTQGVWPDVESCDRADDIRIAVLADRTELMRLSRAEYEWPPSRIKYREIGLAWGWIFWAAIAQPEEHVILLAVACASSDVGAGLQVAEHRLVEYLRVISGVP
jgi:hypothetical protein